VRSFTTPSLGPKGLAGEGGAADCSVAQRSAFSEAEISPAPAGLGGGSRSEWLSGRRPASAAGGARGSSSRRSLRPLGSGWVPGGTTCGSSSSRRGMASASPGHRALQVQDSIPDSSTGSLGTSLLNGESALAPSGQQSQPVHVTYSRREHMPIQQGVHAGRGSSYCLIASCASSLTNSTHLAAQYAPTRSTLSISHLFGHRPSAV
jgi:hypothetical protein